MDRISYRSKTRGEVHNVGGFVHYERERSRSPLNRREIIANRQNNMRNAYNLRRPDYRRNNEFRTRDLHRDQAQRMIYKSRFVERGTSDQQRNQRRQILQRHAAPSTYDESLEVVRRENPYKRHIQNGRFQSTREFVNVRDGGSRNNPMNRRFDRNIDRPFRQRGSFAIKNNRFSYPQYPQSTSPKSFQREHSHGSYRRSGRMNWK